MQQSLFSKPEPIKWSKLLSSLEVEVLKSKKHKIVKPKHIK